MKARIISAAVALLVSVSFAMAQDVTAPNAVGVKAVLFTFSGLNVLGAGTFNGGIGAKYFLTAPLALRAGVQFNTVSQNVPTTLASGGKDGSNSATVMGITLGAEYHIAFSRVSPFVGGVASFSTSSTKEVDAVNVVNGNERTRENVNTVFAISPGNTLTVGGIGGVEFFITKELSLSAEYQLGVGLPMGYTSTTTTLAGGVTNKSSTDVVGTMRIGITNNGALTLSVYF